MPSVSLPQHRWLEWVRHNPAALAKTGLSQAKADEWSHADRGSPWEHRDDGGSVGTQQEPLDPNSLGGIAPSTQTANPLVQGMIQRYASYPPERLQELSVQLRGSPQGQIVQKILDQKRVMSSQDQMPQRADGGMLSPSEATPWWARREATGADASGFLHGTTPGRTDAVKTQAPAGSYVFPADVVAGLGEGNSLAGARVLQRELESGPHGIPMPRGSRGMGPPRPPRAFMQAAGGPVRVFQERKAGGSTDETPVALSHGEYVASPEHAMKWGRGDIKRGHRIFDTWVKGWRRDQIKKLRKLPPPVGSKK